MTLKSLQINLVLLAALVAGATESQSKSTASKPTLVWITFKNCHDGDTCSGLTQEGLKVKIRLEGIDAPELESSHRGKHRPGQAFAAQSRDQLKTWVVGQRLAVKITAVDTYNRYVGLIMNGDRSINERLVNEGFAFAYRGRKASYSLDWALRAEAAAKKSQLGLWALKEPPLKPDQFRRENL
jgi:micrococcal nuclease